LKKSEGINGNKSNHLGAVEIEQGSPETSLAAAAASARLIK
jgi:hypothetical protein